MLIAAGSGIRSIRPRGSTADGDGYVVARVGHSRVRSKRRRTSSFTFFFFRSVRSVRNASHVHVRIPQQTKPAPLRPRYSCGRTADREESRRPRRFFRSRKRVYLCVVFKIPRCKVRQVIIFSRESRLSRNTRCAISRGADFFFFFIILLLCRVAATFDDYRCSVSVRERRFPSARATASDGEASSSSESHFTEGETNRPVPAAQRLIAIDRFVALVSYRGPVYRGRAATEERSTRLLHRRDFIQLPPMLIAITSRNFNERGDSHAASVFF